MYNKGLSRTGDERTLETKQTENSNDEASSDLHEFHQTYMKFIRLT